MSTIKIRTKRVDGATLIRVLITHPMETGRRKDEMTGETVAAHYIRTVRIEHKARTVASCDFSTAVSRDPYVSVRLKGSEPGDPIRVSWEDNQGQKDSQDAVIE